MTNPYRALCAELAEELVNEYGYCTEWEEGLPLCGSMGSELLTRARALLAHPEPQPVAVSERLPGPEDCDEQGRCWMFGNVEGDWRLISTINPGIPKLKYCFSHWLPANALPTPEALDD